MAVFSVARLASSQSAMNTHTFNYSCLEVKNKKSNKKDKADKQRSSKKVKSPIEEEFQVKNEMRELGSEDKDIMHNVLSFFFKHAFKKLYIF